MSQPKSAQDDFLAIASHELKTPITTLKAYTQILQQIASEDSKTSHYLDKMSIQIKKLSILINELLDVSKIDSGKLELDYSQFDLHDLVQDLLEDFSYISKKHHIQVEGNITQLIEADKYRISQVLTNLISNAIKFSPKSDKIVLKISQDKTSAIVAIQDFGIGITQKDTKRIFDRFFQSKNRIRQSFSGLGLGLHISYQIIKKHKGDIWVESQKGQGSIFTLRLPVSPNQSKVIERASQNQNENIYM